MHTAEVPCTALTKAMGNGKVHTTDSRNEAKEDDDTYGAHKLKDA